MEEKEYFSKLASFFAMESNEKPSLLITEIISKLKKPSMDFVILIHNELWSKFAFYTTALLQPKTLHTYRICYMIKTHPRLDKDITKENFRIQLRKIKKILSTMQIMMNSSVNFKLSPDFCQGVKPTTWTQCTRRKYKDTNYCGILSHMVHDPTIPSQHIDYSDEEFDFDSI